jgi:hypothetical protein
MVETYHRRKLVFPRDLPGDSGEHPKDQRRNHETWAWWALMSGHLAVARKHAWTCLRSNPLSPSSWRLLYCCLRGH